MKLILNAMDYQLSALERAAEWGFAMTRCDVLPEYDMTALATAFVDAPVKPLFLIHDLNEPEIIPIACDILGPTGFMAELTNEPDINPPWKDHAGDWADAVCETASWARKIGYTGTIISGGISNLHAEGFTYLMGALSRLPLDIQIGIHRYPGADCDPTTPYPPARTRREECERLLALVAPRKVAHTEGGFHQAEREIPHGFDLPPLTDYEVAERVAYELTLFRGFDFQTYCHYQITDGPGQEFGDKFGILHFDGTVKDDIVKVFQNYREGTVH